MRVLGIDYGRRRIGLAISDATGLLARPWKSISCTGLLSDAAAALVAEIVPLAREADGLGAIVLGLPRRLSGEATELTARVQRLSALLREAVAIPVVLQDERLSSHEAESVLAQHVKDWRQRKPLLDAAAAAVILQDFLDGSRRGQLSREPTSEEDEQR
jgi:putative Holliday junction resolvase